MSITLSGLRYSAPDNSTIDMMVSGLIEGAAIPFTYNPNDKEPLTLAVGEKLRALGAPTILPYQPPR
jgi:hypothetical protein